VVGSVVLAMVFQGNVEKMTHENKNPEERRSKKGTTWNEGAHHKRQAPGRVYKGSHDHQCPDAVNRCGRALVDN